MADQQPKKSKRSHSTFELCWKELEPLNQSHSTSSRPSLPSIQNLSSLTLSHNLSQYRSDSHDVATIAPIFYGSLQQNLDPRAYDSKSLTNKCHSDIELQLQDDSNMLDDIVPDDLNVNKPKKRATQVRFHRQNN